jgi:hypothetical protein
MVGYGKSNCVLVPYWVQLSAGLSTLGPGLHLHVYRTTMCSDRGAPDGEVYVRSNMAFNIWVTLPSCVLSWHEGAGQHVPSVNVHHQNVPDCVRLYALYHFLWSKRIHWQRTQRKLSGTSHTIKTHTKPYNVSLSYRYIDRLRSLNNTTLWSTFTAFTQRNWQRKGSFSNLLICLYIYRSTSKVTPPP